MMWVHYITFYESLEAKDQNKIIWNSYANDDASPNNEWYS